MGVGKDFVCDIISGRFVLYLFIWIAQSWNTDLRNTVKLEQLVFTLELS